MLKSLILSADDSMKLLFSDGDGPVYKICVSWLSSGDQHLEISGCLAVGNFGRTGRELAIERVENSKVFITDSIGFLILRFSSEIYWQRRSVCQKRAKVRLFGEKILGLVPGNVRNVIGNFRNVLESLRTSSDMIDLSSKIMAPPE